MADSTTNIDLISESQAQKAAAANALFDANSPATGFGRRARTCIGLTWGYYGGVVNIGGTPTVIPNGTLALDASSTCYIRQNNATGAVDFVTSPPAGWPGPVTGYTALYEVVTGSATVTSYTDYRTAQGAGVPGADGADGAGYTATSSTSLATAGSGSKTFTTQAGLAYTTGARIRATSTGTSEWMEGVVTSYSGTSLVVTMDKNSGTGTHADWDINLAGEPGADGANGADGADGANWSVTVNAQTGTTYTLDGSDNGVVVTLNNASPITVTVPAGLGANFACECIQIGAGQVTFSASGVTLNSYLSQTKIAGQHGAVTLVAYVADVFNLAGNLAS